MYGTVIPYTLTPEELELARSGRLKEIPTAADRGLSQEMFEPERLITPTEPIRKRVSKYEGITKEFWQAEVEKGKSHNTIGIELGLPPGTLPWLLKRFGYVGRAQKVGGSREARTKKG
ncbi:MAG: hypothetical protein K0Q94_568 [Paenibacillus sp.]|jgi:hypothetical protein|nr:hypothetical protein [Paenibacillus sp.]